MKNSLILISTLFASATFAWADASAGAEFLGDTDSTDSENTGTQNSAAEDEVISCKNDENQNEESWWEWFLRERYLRPNVGRWTERFAGTGERPKIVLGAVAGTDSKASNDDDSNLVDEEVLNGDESDAETKIAVTGTENVRIGTFSLSVTSEENLAEETEKPLTEILWGQEIAGNFVFLGTLTEISDNSVVETVSNWDSLVNYLSAGSNVELAQDISASNTNPLTISSGTLELRGNGYVITGTDSAQITIESNTSLELVNITLTGFSSSSTEGSAIKNSGTLSIDSDTVISNNSGSWSNGGAIYNSGTISEIAGTFSGNKMDNGYGGAIYNASGAEILSITGTFFENGGTNTNGGAIYNDDSATIDKISNAIFKQNKVQKYWSNYYGAAIWNSGTINEILDTDFIENDAVNDGGAIANSNGTIGTISNVNFIENKGVWGAVIWNFGSSNITLITNSNFTGNSADIACAIHNDGNATIGTIEKTIFKENTTGNGHGAGIYNDGLITTISDSKFLNNVVGTEYGSPGGAAIYTNGRIVTITGCEFSGNVAVNFGGAIYNNNSGYIGEISGTLFSNNTTTGLGGAIYNSGTITIVANDESGNTSFSGNTAGGVSNAIHNTGNLNLNASGNGTITFDDAISGSAGTINISNSGSGRVVFNAAVAGNAVNLLAGTLILGDAGTVDGGVAMSAGTELVKMSEASGGSVALTSATGTISVMKIEVFDFSNESVSVTTSDGVELSVLAAWSFEIVKDSGTEVTVSMDVGTGLNADEIVILHLDDASGSEWTDYSSQISNKIYDSSTGTLSFTTKSFSSYAAAIIPEPSLFGLLAGTLALSLAATRRSRRKKL